MFKYLRKAGISSQVLYSAGLGSIGLAIASWVASLKLEEAGRARADRWGIFVGEWAPTFFAMGIAMRLEEELTEERLAARVEEVRRRTAQPMPVGEPSMV